MYSLPPRPNVPYPTCIYRYCQCSYRYIQQAPLCYVWYSRLSEYEMFLNCVLMKHYINLCCNIHYISMNILYMDLLSKCLNQKGNLKCTKDWLKLWWHHYWERCNYFSSCWNTPTMIYTTFWSRQSGDGQFPNGRP